MKTILILKGDFIMLSKIFNRLFKREETNNIFAKREYGVVDLNTGKVSTEVGEYKIEGDTIKTPFATIKVDPHDELIEFLIKDNFINDEDLMTQLLDEED